jgi:hypothetical protein
MAKIDIEIIGSPIIEPLAITSKTYDVRCDKALIHTQAKRASLEDVSARTGTHQANYWRFADRTAVRILSEHQEIKNAIDKRLRTAAQADRLLDK